MNPKQINATIKQKRVVLDFGQALFHYSLAWFLLLSPAFSLFDLIKNYFVPTYNANPATDLTSTNIYHVVAALASYVFQRWRLRFSQYKINLSQDDFEEAVRRTARIEQWSITTYNKQIIQAIHCPDIWMGAGEMITIMKQDNIVLINSISNPNERGWSFFGRQNRRNIASLLDNLRDVANQVPEKNPELEIPEKEWTLKKIVTRLILYPLCVILILIGIFLMVKVGSKAIVPAIGCIAAASIYLYSDLKIITKKATSTSDW